MKMMEWLINKVMRERKININRFGFRPGMEIRTTIFPRKLFWEEVQIRKIRGEWKGGDESDWMSNLSIFEEIIKRLKSMGVVGGRLVVANFEVCEDGHNFNWKAMETGIEIMSKYKMKVDLCIGPVDFPYGPAGIRLPGKLLEELKQEFNNKGQNKIRISMEEDPKMPQSSRAIRDFGLRYAIQALKKFGKDKRVDKIYIGNEWPDEHLIEEVEGVFEVGEDYMMEVAKIALRMCRKKVGVNTNIHPSNLGKMKSAWGKLLDILGERGVLGIDAYPTEEKIWQRLNYGKSIEKVRRLFPKTKLIFTELQGEPWPRGGWSGKSWAEIIAKRPDIIGNYYKNFVRTWENYVVSSGITEIGLWGAPAWIVDERMGKGEAAEIIRTIAKEMKEQKNLDKG